MKIEQWDMEENWSCLLNRGVQIKVFLDPCLSVSVKPWSVPDPICDKVWWSKDYKKIKIYDPWSVLDPSENCSRYNQYYIPQKYLDLQKII